MNLEHLRQRLVEAARSQPADPSVPPGFEHRVVRFVLSQPRPEPWLEWLDGLRRAAVLASALAAVAILLHVMVPPQAAVHPEASDTPDPLDAALLADVSHLMDEALAEEAAP